MLWYIYQGTWQPLALSEAKGKIMFSGWADSRARSSAINLRTQRCWGTRRATGRSGRCMETVTRCSGRPEGRAFFWSSWLAIKPRFRVNDLHRTQVTTRSKLYIWPGWHKFSHIQLQVQKIYRELGPSKCGRHKEAWTGCWSPLSRSLPTPAALPALLTLMVTSGQDGGVGKCWARLLPPPHQSYK